MLSLSPLAIWPTLSRWLERLWRGLAWALLALGFLLALAWGVLHVWIVPRIGELRPELEQLARRQLGVPVQIGQIEATATGWVPSFELREVRLLDAHGQTTLSLPRVALAISLRSVLQLHLEQLVLDRPEVQVRRDRDGHWWVAGIQMSAQGGDSALADWLLAQREVVVRGGLVHWQDETADAAAAAPVFRDLDLVLRNGPRAHLFRLDLSPPVEAGARLVLSGQFRRGLLSVHAGRWREWTGQVYVHAPELDLAPWGRWLPTRMALPQGRGAVRGWLELAQGQWREAVADVALRELRLQVDPAGQALALKTLSGRLSASWRTQGLNVRTRDLAFETASGLQWPGGNVALEWTPAGTDTPERGTLSADRLDLQALRELALRLPMPEAMVAPLQAASIKGLVTQLQWRWQGPWQQAQDWSLKASAQQLALQWPETMARPGLSGAQLELSATPKEGQLQLSMPKGGQLQLNGWLDEPILPMNELRGDLRWRREASGWVVPAWNLWLANADARGQFKGSWHSAADGVGPGHLTLSGQIPQLAATRVQRYLPPTLPKAVRQYVREAITRGQVQNIQVQLQGPLSSFPFANPALGEFRVSARLRDVGMNYVPTYLLPAGGAPWPALYDLDGELVFDRLSMRLSQASARGLESKTGVTISNLQAHIPDLAHDAQLQVSGDLRGTVAQTLQIIQGSPLGRMLGGSLAASSGSGTVQTRLQLNIPLLRVPSTQVQGLLQFAGNDLQLDPAIPTLERVQGSLQFSEKGFALQGVQARTLDGPIRLEGGLRDQLLSIRGQGQVGVDGLRQATMWAPLDRVLPYLKGSAAYSTTVQWSAGLFQVAVQSNLEGMALNLPAPLGKRAEQAMPLQLERRVEGSARNQREQLSLGLGQIASVQYVRDLSGTSPRVLRGHLAVGVGALPLPGMPASGVSAQVQLDQLSLDDWASFWPTGGASPQDMDSWSAYLPTQVRLQTAQLTLDKRTLRDLRAQLMREGTLWRGQVDAREISGQFEYRPAQADQPARLFARLPRLSLPPSSVSEVEAALEAPPLSLPTLDIVIEQLELRGKLLGRLEIEASNREVARSGGPLAARTPREWQLNKFNLTLPEAQLRSRGRWMGTGDSNSPRRSDIEFELDIASGGALLDRMGTPGALRATPGRIAGQVQWAGSPLSPHFPSMTGRFRMEMGRGQFLKADPGVAKLLGVLSLQALPRRLLLDFSDVFREGFLFDSAQGDVVIERGIASTRNLQIKGVNALVQMEGRVDLIHETQQLQVLVLPSLDAGTAALVAGITAGPVVGLTSFLAQLFLQKPLTRASSQVFVIDGSWSDPRVTRVDSPGPAAAPTQRP
ncbi:MAG: hypothetical protein RIQ97_1762 [Pseudomonadota bacterium]